MAIILKAFHAANGLEQTLRHGKPEIVDTLAVADSLSRPLVDAVLSRSYQLSMDSPTARRANVLVDRL